MNRRCFLGTMAAAALAARAKSAPVGGIIDTHTHFYDPSRPQGVPWPAKTNPVLYQPMLPPRFRQVAETFGVAGTIVIEASGWLEDNQYLLDLARDEPFLVGVVGNYDSLASDCKGHLARLSRNPLVRGLRTHATRLRQGLDRPSFLDEIKAMVDLDLTLDIGGGPEMFTELAFFRPRLDEIWAVFGSDRVVYGSNWPVTEMYAPYSVVLKLVTDYFAEKGDAALRRYLHTNSATAYKWIQRT